MRVRCTSPNRDLILRVLREKVGETGVYHSLPDFAYTVGAYTLRRDGWVVADEDSCGVAATLSELGLCDGSLAPQTDCAFSYPTAEHTGQTLLNLLCIVSARQHLLNRALAARGAFRVDRSLMEDLLAHPPLTCEELLQGLWRRDAAYRGIRLSRGSVVLCGFERGPAEERELRQGLADLMVAAALQRRWTKAFCPRVRNQRYAFRTWLNALGMSGPAYERERALMLSRLPGRSDRRGLGGARRAEA